MPSPKPAAAIATQETAAVPARRARSEAEAAFSVLLRARFPLVWVTTAEEQRVERLIAAEATRSNYAVRFWDSPSGCTTPDGERYSIGGSLPDNVPDAVLARI